MSIIDKLKLRVNGNSYTDFQLNTKTDSSLIKMQNRLNVRGGSDQWTRMRQDKLRSLKKALLYSYQSAIVQKYDVKKDSLVNNIISIISLLQDKQTLSVNQEKILDELQETYNFIIQDRDSLEYIEQLQNVIDSLVTAEPLFRCLINHDKLKVDYEDKIISIPFFQAPIDSDTPIETNFHNGTVFKWVHGNKQEWTPDTYWIVYMQYSEETAYFRAEIRKADQEIEIITVDEEGNETSTTYRGWMTGPNETSAIWNVKKGVVWNDMNYTKLLYITKDQDTLAFFQRFDRVIINGKPWEVQAYNQNYSTSKTGEVNSGIIRVALKETYLNTDEFIKQKMKEETTETPIEDENTSPYIEGPTSAKPYSILTFTAKNFIENGDWTISNSSLAKIRQIKNNTVTVEIVTGRSNSEGFYINYGNNQETRKNVKIQSF